MGVAGTINLNVAGIAVGDVEVTISQINSEGHRLVGARRKIVAAVL